MNKNIFIITFIIISVILLTSLYLFIGKNYININNTILYYLMVGVVEELIVFIPAFILYYTDKDKNLGKLFLYYFIGKLAFIGMEIYVRELFSFIMVVIVAVHLTYSFLFAEISRNNNNNIIIGLSSVMIIHFLYDYLIYTINSNILGGLLFIGAIIILILILTFIKDYFINLIYEYE